MRTSFNLFLISVLVSIIIVSTININWNLYISVIALLSILILLNFSFKANLKLYLKFLIINYAFLLCYLQKIYGVDIRYFYVTIFIMIIVIIINNFNKKKRNSKKTSIENSLIPKRLEDLNYLEHYIRSFQIVGLTGSFGTGKTFLVNHLKKRLENEYEFIEIDLLTSNLNEIQLTLINSFEELLLKNKIFPKHAHKLKKEITSMNIFAKIQSVISLIFNSNDLKAATYKSFLEETTKIDKKILIIFEDLDRIENKEAIKEIFAISEKLSSSQIKILYQYDEVTLTLSGFTYDYIEKYIPYRMNITKLHIEELIEIELKNSNEYELSIKDFNFLSLLNLNHNPERPFISFNYVPIRKVKNMLAEIDSTIKSSKNALVKDKNLIIRFFLLKHLLPDYFEKINHEKSLSSALTFMSPRGEISIFDLEEIDERTFSEEIISNELSLTNYNILSFFEYRFSPNVKLSEKHKNDFEKKDRLIKKLLYQGTSHYTDYENLVNKFCESVLSIPLANQNVAYKTLEEDFYFSNKKILDNETVFKMGIPRLESIYEAFSVVQKESKSWNLLNSFYFHYRNSQYMDVSLLKCMSLAHLNNEENILQVIRYFNNLVVNSNFNHFSVFWGFLDNSISSLYTSKIISGGRYEYSQNLDDHLKIDHSKEMLNWILEEITFNKNYMNKNNLIDFETIFEDIEIFLNKLLEIMDCPTPYKAPRIINTEFSSIINEEFETLKLKITTSPMSKEECFNRITRSYNDKAISLKSAIELFKLVDSVTSKNNENKT